MDDIRGNPQLTSFESADTLLDGVFCFLAYGMTLQGAIMAKRKSTGKKSRFEVFKRDGFKCQYCGRTPPDVVLEVDHVIPISADGEHIIDNMVTACFDCNRGKGNRQLIDIPETIQEKAEKIIEREDQIKEFSKLLSKIRKREEADINKIENVFSSYYEGYSFADIFRNSIRKNFLNKIQCQELCDHMHTACNKANNRNSSIKYFCGICWNVIKGKGEA